MQEKERESENGKSTVIGEGTARIGFRKNNIKVFELGLIRCREESVHFLPIKVKTLIQQQYCSSRVISPRRISSKHHEVIVLVSDKPPSGRWHVCVWGCLERRRERRCHPTVSY